MLPNISRCKSNQAMKFGQIIEHNTRNIFVEKSFTKCAGETIPRSYSSVDIFQEFGLDFKQFCVVAHNLQKAIFQNNSLRLLLSKDKIY